MSVDGCRRLGKAELQGFLEHGLLLNDQVAIGDTLDPGLARDVKAEFDLRASRVKEHFAVKD